MTTGLSAFFDLFGGLPPAVLADMTARFNSCRVQRGQLLLQPGAVCRELLFVQSGCLRTYYLGASGQDISMWFSFPGYLSAELTSFFTGQPSVYAVEALAAGEVLALPQAALYELYAAHPSLHATMRQVWEYVIVNVIGRFTSLQHDTAEQRYLALLQQPGYLGQIPQKHLASYIGVTPSSLSRIRRRLS